MNINALLKLHDVGKWFVPGRWVIKDVSLQLYKAETICLLGANGAGKSTLLRILAGLSQPSTGTMEASPHTKIGYVPERFPTMLRFTPREYLLHMAMISGMDQQTAIARINENLSFFHLTEVANTRIELFSKGMRQKVSLAQGLLHQPNVLIVDEPFSGLDQQILEELLERLKALKANGIGMVISTHQNELATIIADRIVTINGKTLVSNDADHEKIKQIVVSYEGKVQMYQVAAHLCDQRLRELLSEGASIVSVNDRTVKDPLKGVDTE